MISMINNRMTAEIKRQTNLASALARSQVEISTGKKIQIPSDDPVASERIGYIRQTQSNHEAWTSNLSLGISLVEQAGGVMSAVSDRLAHARELSIAGASRTLSDVDRETIVSELRSLADEVAGLSSTQSSLGTELFSSGPALKFRFGEFDLLEPIPMRQDAFELNGTSLSQIISEAASALSSEDEAEINLSLSALERGINKSASVAADIGVRGNRMINIRERMIDEDIILTTERSGLEDTDLNVAIGRLNQKSLSLDAARAAFARINRQTLFDLLN
jgi:flagellar hook-associated protein 3 FlgL